LCSDVSLSHQDGFPCSGTYFTLHTPAMLFKELSQVPGEGILMNVKFLGGIIDSTNVCGGQARLFLVHVHLKWCH